MTRGEKTGTTRTRRFGSPGDKFFIFGTWFIITHVVVKELHQVAHNHYEEEGFDSSQGFISMWKRLHPIRGYRPMDTGYFHKFKFWE